MPIRVLDPTHETDAPQVGVAPRLAGLRGTTIGFVSNGKEGTKGFFRHLEQLLVEEHGVARVVTRVKSNYSAPADKHIADEMTQWHAVVSGIGD